MYGFSDALHMILYFILKFYLNFIKFKACIARSYTADLKTEEKVKTRVVICLQGSGGVFMAGRVTGVSTITACHHSAQGRPGTAGKCLQEKIGKIVDKERNHSLAKEQHSASGTCPGLNVAMNPRWKAMGGDALTHGTLHKSEILNRTTESVRLGNLILWDSLGPSCPAYDRAPGQPSRGTECHLQGR